MSLKTETFTLSDLEGRVREDGDCLVWTGSASDGRRPMIWIDGRSLGARRLVYTLVHGPIKQGRRIGVKCDNELCLNPEHLVAKFRSQETKGKPRDAAFKAKVAAGKRANSALTPDLINLVRTSPLNNCALGREIGLNHQTIAKIRRHEIWKNYSSPFAGLGA